MVCRDVRRRNRASVSILSAPPRKRENQQILILVGVFYLSTFIISSRRILASLPSPNQADLGSLQLIASLRHRRSRIAPDEPKNTSFDERDVMRYYEDANDADSFSSDIDEKDDANPFQLDATYLYKDQEELRSRHLRFPSLERRVKIYMSNWYTPPCKDNSNGFAQYAYKSDGKVSIREIPTQQQPKRRTFEIDNNPNSTEVFVLDKHNLERCNHEYCNDTKTYIIPAIEHATFLSTKTLNTPYLMRYGDHETSKALVPVTGEYELSPNLPVIRKFRRALPQQEIERLTSKKCYHFRREVPQKFGAMQPVVWFLKSARHYGMLKTLQSDDIPWSQKKNAAIFRGGATGIHRHGLTLEKIKRGISLREICRLIPRCNLVYQSSNSKLVDAQLTPSLRSVRSKDVANFNYLPNVIDGIQIYGERIQRRDMLKYKAIIILEGNDVSSGLKWALMSNSVVLMPPVTFTSWAMEELLEPWVHYIPLNTDLSDIGEKVQWMLDNDREAESIAYRGSLWIKDLMFHPDAERESNMIFDEMIQRYRVHFIETPGVSDGISHR